MSMTMRAALRYAFAEFAVALVPARRLHFRCRRRREGSDLAWQALVLHRVRFP